jgi:hypothetical protein
MFLSLVGGVAGGCYKRRAVMLQLFITIHGGAGDDFAAYSTFCCILEFCYITILFYYIFFIGTNYFAMDILRVCYDSTTFLLEVSNTVHV